MGQFTPPAAGRSSAASSKVAAPSVGAAVIGIVLTFSAVGWLVVVAPPLASFALALAAAFAWCAWLEQHPEAPVDAEQRAQDRVTTTLDPDRRR